MSITWKQTGPNRIEITGSDNSDNFLLMKDLWVYDYDNVIFAGGGNDTFNAGSGNDTLNGGLGDDMLDGSFGNDLLDGGQGADLLLGGFGNDTLDGGLDNGAEKDTMDGGLGNDTYVIRDGADVIVGEEAYATYQSNDTIRLLTGSIDLMATASLQAIENVTSDYGANIKVTGNALANVIDASGLKNGASAIVHGGEGADTITGSSAADQLYGDQGNDVINGGAGNDSLYGGAGDDTMTGGAGNDRYEVRDSGDVIVEAAGGGQDVVDIYLASYTMAANVEEANVRTAGSTVTGNGLANRISGGDGADKLYGGAGDDTLAGGKGDDYLVGGAGADVMDGGQGNDTYLVDSASDKVIESIFSSGHDTIYTTLNAYALSDAVLVEDLKFIGSGGFTGSGNSLNNMIEGGYGSDQLLGYGGNDTLIGHGGSDKLWGGAGADQFWFSDSDPNMGTVVKDFDKGIDKIVIEANGQWGQHAYGANAVLLTSYAGGGTILVEGTTSLNWQTDILLI